MEPDHPDNLSIRELMHGILSDLGTLFHEEMELARTEIRARTGRAGAALAALGVALAALSSGALFLLVALALGTADLMNWPPWAGFLVVALAVCAVGSVALAVGRRKLRALSALPVETISTLKENSEWIAKRLSSAPR